MWAGETSDRRPEWAVNLPSLHALQYTQALLVASALVVLSLYIAARVAANPGAAIAAARRKTGV